MIGIDYLLQQSNAETALLILTCRVYISTETQESLLSFLQQHHTSINYQKFYQLVKRNRIRPVVYNVLSPLPVDSALLQWLEADCRLITLNAFKNLKETERMITLLEEKNIAAVPYRGVLFSKMYYGDWGIRESSDIDFLVQQKDIPALLSIIEEENYHLVIPPGDYRNKYLYSSALSIDVNNDTNQQRNIHLEFHYNISPACYSISAGYQELVKKNVFFRLNDRNIPILSPNDNAQMLLAHHGLNDIWVSLKYYLDMAVVVKTGSVNWQEVKAFCRRNGYCQLSAAGLHNMELLLGIDSPFQVSEKEKDLANKLFPLSIFPDQYQQKKRYKLYLRIKGRDNIWWKLKTIKGLCSLILKPSEEDFKWKYFPSYLFGLYYICKPIRLFNKYVIQPTRGKKPEVLFR